MILVCTSVSKIKHFHCFFIFLLLSENSTFCFQTFVWGNMESVQYDVHAAAFWTKLGEIFKCLFYLLVKMMLIVSTSFFFLCVGVFFVLFFSRNFLFQCQLFSTLVL